MGDNNLTRRDLPAPLFHIDIDGSRHVAAAVLAAQSGYTRDYIARLARQHRIEGRQLGTHWYINEASFREFIVQQEASRAERRHQLAAVRRNEYYDAQSAPKIAA
jgi:cytidylate kinase